MASIEQNNARSDFSSYNNNKDIAAYGRGIWTTTNVDSTSYTSDYGTSFAAPMAAGAAALVFSLRPDFTPELVQSVLTSSSIDMGAEGKDPCFGHGRLRVSDAVKALTDPAPGNVVASGYYTMASSLGSSLVMDVDGASTANDAKVVSYTRNWTAAQLFQLVYNSSDGCYTVKNPHSSKVLDIPGNRAVEGQKPCQYTPNGTDAQRWRVEPLGSNRFRLYAAHSGLAMDAAAGMTANGTNVITWTPNGNNAQVWVLTKAA